MVLMLVLATMATLSFAGGDDESGKADGKYQYAGKFYTKEDIPTYNVSKEGSLDWYAYSGFRRYHSECMVCHGPDGLGSSFAPALATSLKTMDYYSFKNTVMNGRENVGSATQSIMPAFAANPNVMCYLDDIYVYLKGRADNAIERARPPKRDPKPDQAREDENACLDG